MYHTKPMATYESLKSLYLAIKKDDAAALESVLKENHIDIDQPISVYDDNYEPVNRCSLFNTNRTITTKKPAEIANAMGHVECLHWLLENGADIKPLLEYAISLQTESLSAYQCRFIDDKTNYKQAAFLEMAYIEKLNPEELEGIRDMFANSDGSDNEESYIQPGLST
ncbi:hypothetical protein [Legionella sainthelensi]|uniref:Ankyrin repeat domain-containing protein n=1 Tax=Legionella sainthelensi TaxID=28087 RepID=A0A2H5FLZ2_9GAMM|nr:hypothetical protein [Legionella sainthelensi]AUH72569.1 hypothetical protein CAB17_11240 [Legionella sainthelensi]